MHVAQSSFGASDVRSWPWLKCLNSSCRSINIGKNCLVVMSLGGKAVLCMPLLIQLDSCLNSGQPNVYSLTQEQLKVKLFLDRDSRTCLNQSQKQESLHLMNCMHALYIIRTFYRNLSVAFYPSPSSAPPPPSCPL